MTRKPREISRGFFVAHDWVLPDMVRALSRPAYSESVVILLAAPFIECRIKNYQKLAAAVEESKAATEKALSVTVKDMKSRAPGKIASRVAGRYGIKKGEVTPVSTSAKKPQTKAVGVKVTGDTIETLCFIYKGRLLTLTHFKMKPTTRPAAGTPYTVTAEVFKGERKAAGPDVFLGGNSGGGDIPFKREGTARLPIKAVKTLSVPQMLGDEQVGEGVQEDMGGLLAQRLEYHMGRMHK